VLVKSLVLILVALLLVDDGAASLTSRIDDASDTSSALRGGFTAATERKLQQIKITRLALIKAETREEITSVDLSLGGTIVLDELPTTKLSVEAIVEGGTPDAVYFFWNGSQHRTEQIRPYSLCGDRGNRLHICSDMTEGTHEIMAIALVDNSPVSSVTVIFERECIAISKYTIPSVHGKVNPSTRAQKTLHSLTLSYYSMNTFSGVVSTRQRNRSDTTDGASRRTISHRQLHGRERE